MYVSFYYQKFARMYPDWSIFISQPDFDNNISYLSLKNSISQSIQFQMLAVRFLGRMPTAATTLVKQTSCLRLLAGLTGGGSALTIAWRHYRVYATSPPKFDSNKMQSIVRDLERKKISSAEKFDWNLFWYYLRPQIWIIACATAVSPGFFSFHYMKSSVILDCTCCCLFECCYSIRIRKAYQCSIEFTYLFIFIHRF
jgi:hypothetical protein